MDEETRSLRELSRKALRANDFLGLERLGRQLTAHGESTRDSEAVAWGNYNLGIALTSLNRGAEAARATRSAIELFEAIGDRFAKARAMMNLALVELENNGNVTVARRLYEESEPIIRDCGEPLRLAIALGNIGEMCRMEGDYRGALRKAQESLAIFRSIGDVGNATWPLADIACYHCLLRDRPAAIANMREAAGLLRESPDPRHVVWCFDTAAILAERFDYVEQALRLLSFNDRFRDENNQPRTQALLPWLSTTKERIARDLSPERIDQLVIEGEELTLEEAAQLVEGIA
jgi:tetratricopeptide (TPR) repeat protein